MKKKNGILALATVVLCSSFAIPSTVRAESVELSSIPKDELVYSNGSAYMKKDLETVVTTIGISQIKNDLKNIDTQYDTFYDKIKLDKFNLSFTATIANNENAIYDDSKGAEIVSEGTNYFEVKSVNKGNGVVTVNVPLKNPEQYTDLQKLYDMVDKLPDELQINLNGIKFNKNGDVKLTINGSVDGNASGNLDYINHKKTFSYEWASSERTNGLKFELEPLKQKIENVNEFPKEVEKENKIEAEPNGAENTKPSETENSVESKQGESEKVESEVKADNPKFNPPSKRIKVIDPNSLTLGEGEKIEKEFIKANPQYNEKYIISINHQNGEITITEREKLLGKITSDKTVEKGINAPKKTKVENPEKLTESEINAIKVEIKKENPGITETTVVEVDEKGNVTVKEKNEVVGTLKSDEVIEKKQQTEKPSAPIKHDEPQQPKESENKDEQGITQPKTETESNETQPNKDKKNTEEVQPNKDKKNTEQTQPNKDKKNTEQPKRNEQPRADKNLKLGNRAENRIDNANNKIFVAKPRTSSEVKTAQPSVNKKSAYINGYPDGTFRANQQMTRAEVVSILSKVYKDKLKTGAIGEFSDVKASAWYYDAVNLLCANKVIEGENGNFRPNEIVTRAEFVAMIARIEKMAENNSTFSDVNENHWASKFIGAAVQNKLVDGYVDGTFKPEQGITRAEVVTIMNRVLNVIPNKEYIDNNISNYKQFSDLQNTHWAYYNIMEASK